MDLSPRRLRDMLLLAQLPGPVELLAAPARFAWVLYLALVRDRAFVRAAAMAYMTLVALVPLLLLLFGASALFGLGPGRMELLERVVFDSVVGQVPEARDFLIEGLRGLRLGSLGLVGIGGLVVVAGRLFLFVEDAYCDIFGVENHRSWWLRIRLFLTFGGISVGVLVLGARTVDGWIRATGAPVAEAFVVGMQALGLVAALKLLPSVRVRWRSALLGGLVSVALLQLAARGFRAYLGVFGGDPAQVLYGSVGLIPLVLLWLYYVWLVVLIGVEVAAVSQDFRQLWEAARAAILGEEGHPGAADVDVALWMAARVASVGGGLDRHGLAQRTGLSPRDAALVARGLERIGVLARTENGTWLLARPASGIMLKEIAGRWRAMGAIRPVDPRRRDGPLTRLRHRLDAGLDGTLAELAVELREGTVPPAPPADEDES